MKLDAPRRIWIDIDNSPHVPFFVPIIEELGKRGHEVIVTARDAYQVRDLSELYDLPCKIVGKHYGKNPVAKILGTCLRAAQLLPRIFHEKIDLAVSHGSRAQMMCGFALGIPTLLILDYEYIAIMGFIRPDWILVPEIIPDSKELKPKRQSTQVSWAERGRICSSSPIESIPEESVRSWRGRYCCHRTPTRGRGPLPQPRSRSAAGCHVEFPYTGPESPRDIASSK